MNGLEKDIDDFAAQVAGALTAAGKETGVAHIEAMDEAAPKRWLELMRDVHRRLMGRLQATPMNSADRQRLEDRLAATKSQAEAHAEAVREKLGLNVTIGAGKPVIRGPWNRPL
ncbi:hypothetical protein [Paraburkholderia fungorum]